jgi:hypothetical protein
MPAPVQIILFATVEMLVVLSTAFLGVLMMRARKSARAASHKVSRPINTNTPLTHS